MQTPQPEDTAIHVFTCCRLRFYKPHYLGVENLLASNRKGHLGAIMGSTLLTSDVCSHVTV